MEPLEILTEEYVALRAEICQSITYQHQILLGGYGLAAAAVGAIAGSSAVDRRAFIVVPIVLLGMVCLWAVECNRMVRASYYIAYRLWPRMSELVHQDTSSGWETWIRMQDGDAGTFRRRQDLLQQVATVLVPFVFSVSAAVVAVAGMRASRFLFVMALVASAFQLGIWIMVYREIRRISDLGACVPDKGAA